MDNMGSAHPLVEVNMSFKFEGNPSIGIGFTGCQPGLSQNIGGI